jgi:hypothetical protein
MSLAGQRRYTEALHVMRDSITADPRGAEKPANGVRYQAARAAIRCGTGQGLEPVPPAERPGLRREALAWLTVELAAWKAARGTHDGDGAHEQMRQWLADGSFTLVRHPIAVGLLPADERPGWRALWNAVRQFYESTAPELAPAPRPKS